MKLHLPFDSEIPEEHSRYGEERSPKLDFSDIPREAEKLALIMDDPDAPGGTFVHWVLWNIPVDGKVPGDLPSIQRLGESGAVHGTNDYGEIGYGGPKPPSGTHTYRFRAYALDGELDLGPGAEASELESAMEGHIVDQTVRKADYSKP